jgi:hypothetical protein
MTTHARTQLPFQPVEVFRRWILPGTLLVSSACTADWDNGFEPTAQAELPLTSIGPNVLVTPSPNSPPVSAVVEPVPG